jgi:hypothetical protein
MLLSAETIKLASITQNNYVYEHTAEGLTPEILLNVRSPYRRQKRDFSIIRSSFRRSHTRIEILAINITTFLSTISTILLPSCDRLFLIFLSFCDHIDYFLSFYFLATISTISYLSIFLRLYRLYLYLLS